MPRRRLTAALSVGALLAVVSVAAAGFDPIDPYPTGGNVFGIAVGDVNRDGKADILAGNDNGDDHISLLPGRGDATFRAEKVINDPRGPEGMVLAKLDGDKRKDLAVADYGNNGESKVSIFLATRRGGLRLERKLAAGPGAWLIEAGDLNDNGKTDLVLANFDTDGPDAVSVFLGKGDGKFKGRKDYEGTTGDQSGIVLADLDENDTLDVVTIDRDVKLTVFQGEGDGTLQPGEIEDFSTATAGYGLVAGRFDAGDTLDLAAPLISSGEATIFPGNGDGSFAAGVPTESPDAGNGIAAAELTGDGLLDLAVGRETGGVNIMHGNGSGGFGFVQSIVAGDPATWVETARLDGNQRIDVVLGTETGVSVLPNNNLAP